MSGHNYLKKISDTKELLQPGTVWEAIVAHDDCCSFYSGKGKVCDCNPEIIYRPATTNDEEEKP